MHTGDGLQNLQQMKSDVSEDEEQLTDVLRGDKNQKKLKLHGKYTK